MKIGIFNILKSVFSSLFNPSSEDRGGRNNGPVELSRPFTLVDDCDREDPLFREIMEKDLKGMDTPLKLMKRYADILNRGTSHGDIDEKLDRLFLCGKTPHSLDGYYHGITISLKTGTESHSILEDIRKKLNIGEGIDPLQVFYGRLLSKTSPWAGKNFKRLAPDKLNSLTEGFDKGEETTYLGINSFRKDNKGFVNNLSGYLLSAVIDMEGVPGPDKRQRSWIYAKGGLFIAKRQGSVDLEHPEKEVMALNYRWKSLGNGFPNRLLIDEIVEIADGLYLGRLFYATALKYITEDYDPLINIEDYKYRSFGYFLLMDDTWLHEKNMLFPDLTYKMADNLPEKFSTFHLIDSPESRAIQEGLDKGKTILHHLQDLSKGVKEGEESEDRYFKEIHRLFMCGQRPDGIQGFLHGGVVAFRSSGFLKKLGTNILNDLWPAVRPFSPWTGKTFTNSTVEGIRKYIGKDADHYKEAESIIAGTNTYRKDLDLSLPTTVFIEQLNKIGMVVEYPNDKEKDEDIYMKSFYFIATNDRSINPECKDKEVLRFNYRWPEFHTMPPDNLCIDELVRIADGLYLGQLLYSTRPEIVYDPGKDPAIYNYEHFGYFMLMDDEWYFIKEFIIFDTEK
ncbi:MAG: hypothetical protein ACE5IH_05900 [Thermodesulfobacteriota bacterium]